MAYDRAHAPPERNWVIRASDTRYYTRPRRSLLDHILLDRPAAFIPLDTFEEEYEITFPEMTSPIPPMPERFHLTPTDWSLPSNPMPPIYHTPNAAPSSITEHGPDWQMQANLRGLLQILGPPQPTNNAIAALPPTPSPLHPNGLPQPRVGPFRRAPRMIRPLPRRAQMPETSSQTTTVVGFVAQTAAGVGSAIANGIKRLRDGVEEGMSSKRLRIL